MTMPPIQHHKIPARVPPLQGGGTYGWAYSRGFTPGCHIAGFQPLALSPPAEQRRIAAEVDALKRRAGASGRGLPPRLAIRKIILGLGLGLGLMGWLAAAAGARDWPVYFGTFTNETSQGIYRARLDSDTGKLTTPELAVAAPSPNYLAISPDGRFLYAVTRGERFKPEGSGGVSVFAIEGQSGGLKLVGEAGSGGAGPCHVSVDAGGQTVLVANYGGGSVKSFRANRDGTLAEGTFVQHHGSSVNPRRQGAAHAHCFVPAPEGRFALACDLGLDRVVIYPYDPTNGTLNTNDPGLAAVAPGSGPRHLAFSPDGKTAYVVNEMACTVTVFGWDGAKGRLEPRQTLPLLPENTPPTEAFTAAAIAVRPDGRFVYATVRGHDSITVLAVNDGDGKLRRVESVPCGGKVPRGMAIDPTGRWLIVANQASGDVAIFGINADTGRLAPTGQTCRAGTPVDVKFGR